MHTFTEVFALDGVGHEDAFIVACAYFDKNFQISSPAQKYLISTVVKSEKHLTMQVVSAKDT